MMATFRTLQEFCPDEEQIAAYIEHVEVYFKANDIAENKQVPVFLSVAFMACLGCLQRNMKLICYLVS